MADSSPHITASAEEVRRRTDALVEALEQEHERMSVLTARLAEKLDALRTRNAEELEATTLDLSQTIQTLDGLGARRSRCMRELGELLEMASGSGDLGRLADRCRSLGYEDPAERLADWQKTMREQAEQAQHLCEQVAFGLQYAAAIGQEMLEVLRGTSSRDPASTYSPEGRADSDSSEPSFVNRLG